MKKRGDLRFLHLAWEDVQRLSEKIAEGVKISGFRPDLIVAISRGGFDPARILSDLLCIRRLASLQIEYYMGINQRRTVPEIIYPLNADVEGLNVLVVDDVSDSGESLRFVKEYVMEHGASEVKMATLHIKPWTNFKPDYYAEEVDAWIVYPWEPVEAMTSMAEKLKVEGLSDNEICHRLVDLGFAPSIVAKLDHYSSKTYKSSS